MRSLLTILFVSIFHFSGKAQFAEKQKELVARCQNSPSVAEKVEAHGELAAIYFIYQLDDAADSTLQIQLKIAEASGQKDLLIKTFFGEALTHLTTWRSRESFDKALAFLQKGKTFAQNTANDEHMAIANQRIAALYEKWGENDLALNYANAANASAINTQNDSLKIVTILTLGNVWKAKNDALPAFKLYTKAMEDALTTGQYKLVSVINQSFAELYLGLGDKSKALEYLTKNEEQNKNNGFLEGLIIDYINLARITDDKTYAFKAVRLADSLDKKQYSLQALRVVYGIYTLVEKNAEQTLKFINENQDLSLYFKNRGEASMNFTIGGIYFYSAKYDSALNYFLKAKPGLDTLFDAKNKHNFYSNIANSYKELGDNNKAIEYFEQALQFATAIKNLPSISGNTKALSQLYNTNKNFEKAYVYLQRNLRVRDSLNALTNQRDLAIAEINNEAKENDRRILEEKQKFVKKRNLQYMAITLVITLCFITVFVIGMFPVTRLTVKLTSFFIFICLFEFIILLVDTWLHNLAHGEPLKVWLMKIFIIALLVPCQHFLEHRLVEFIQSAKLAKLRMKLLAKRKRTKKSAEEKFDDLEKDTAIL